MSCNMDITSFPFDVQRCEFTVGSQFYDASDAELIPRYNADTGNWSAVSLESYVQNHEWALKNVTVVAECTMYSCCPSCFPTLTYILEMHRWSWVYVCGIIIPLITTTYVAILGGLLHPFSGERVSLAVTMMLTGAAIYLVAADTMPKIGTPTFISRLYLACLAHNFVALAESIIVVSLHNIVAADQVSEQKLVHTFYESTGGKELMDEVDLKVALHILGLREADLDSAVGSAVVPCLFFQPMQQCAA